MAADVYVIIPDDRMRNLATGEVVGSGDEPPTGGGLGFAALGTDPLGE